MQGRFAACRKRAVVVLLGLFYGVAWLQWDGHQALLFDLPARKFYIFGLTLWPQDFFYLALLMIIAALSLFFVTALAGRLWCGLRLPADRLDGAVHLDRAVDGGHALAAHEARSGAVDARQGCCARAASSCCG